jgi:hypothetical protein
MHDSSKQIDFNFSQKPISPSPNSVHDLHPLITRRILTDLSIIAFYDSAKLSGQRFFIGQDKSAPCPLANLAYHIWKTSKHSKTENYKQLS